MFAVKQFLIHNLLLSIEENILSNLLLVQSDILKLFFNSLIKEL